MNYFASISQALAYIEQNLTGDLSLRDIGKRACLSIPHLYRIFPAMVGCTVGQYIRRRRLSEAARCLLTQKSVLEAALEYRFESQEGFIRAFKSLFQVTPGEYKRSQMQLPLYSPVKLREAEKESGMLQPDIVRKRFTLVGMEMQIDLDSDFSEQLTNLTDIFKKGIPAIDTAIIPLRIVNMWYPKFEENLPEKEPETMFFTGIETMGIPTSLPDRMTAKLLPESLYASFEESQRGTMGGPDGYAYRTWLPGSAYRLNEHIPGDLEQYADIEHVGFDDACKILIPICEE